MPDIVALGEPLVEFNQARGGRSVGVPAGLRRRHVEHGDRRRAPRRARGLRRRDSATIAFGRMFVDLWTREGVDTSGVAFDAEAPTGVYFVTHGPQGHEFSYLRAGSAASRMRPATTARRVAARRRGWCTRRASARRSRRARATAVFAAFDDRAARRRDRHLRSQRASASCGRSPARRPIVRRDGRACARGACRAEDDAAIALRQGVRRRRDRRAASRRRARASC